MNRIKVYKAEICVVNKRCGVRNLVIDRIVSKHKSKKLANEVRRFVNAHKRFPFYSDDRFYFRIKKSRKKENTSVWKELLGKYFQ